MMDRNARLARMAGHILEARENVDAVEDALLGRLMDMALMELGTKLAASLRVEQSAPLPDFAIEAARRAPQRGKARRRRAR
jgi:hypothetical protein